MISPELSSIKKPRGGSVFVFGLQVILVGGIQKGVMGYLKVKGDE